MKKLLLLVLPLLLVSCKSSGDFGDRLEIVYDKYDSKLSLEDSTVYVVEEFDTLTKIAKKFWGNENGYYFPLIMLASHNVVSDPDYIMPGMELTIPNFSKNMSGLESRQLFKKYFSDIAKIYLEKDTASSRDLYEQLNKIANDF